MAPEISFSKQKGRAGLFLEFIPRGPSRPCYLFGILKLILSGRKKLDFPVYLKKIKLLVILSVINDKIKFCRLRCVPIQILFRLTHGIVGCQEQMKKSVALMRSYCFF
jgi:hypothetical protein